MIRYAVKTAPDGSIIIPALADVKENLRIESDDTTHDDFIARLIHSAREYCESYLGWRLAECTMYAYLDDFPSDGIIEIQRGPVQSITSIEYKAAGATTYTTMSASNYDLSNHQVKATILIDDIPSVNTDKLDPIRITYVAGYHDADDIPQDIIDALNLRIAERYLNSENAPESIRTKAADVLLRHHKHQNY